MKTKNNSHYGIVLLILLLSTPLNSIASEPNFYLLFDECKTIAGSTLQSDFPLLTLEGVPSSYACEKLEKKLNCAIKFEGGANSVLGENLHTYELTLETSGTFIMTLPGGGDQITVNRDTHTAVIITKISSDKSFGAKVCRGRYFTNDEANELRKNARESQK